MMERETVPFLIVYSQGVIWLFEEWLVGGRYQGQSLPSFHDDEVMNRVGGMLHWFRAQAALAEDAVPFSAPTWGFTVTSN